MLISKVIYANESIPKVFTNPNFPICLNGFNLSVVSTLQLHKLTLEVPQLGTKQGSLERDTLGKYRKQNSEYANV